MARKIVYLKRAEAHLRAIQRYVANDRPVAAENLIARIRKRVDDLLQFPEQGRPGLKGASRELVVNGTAYIVTYKLEGEEIQILMIRHGARRPLS